MPASLGYKNSFALDLRSRAKLFLMPRLAVISQHRLEIYILKLASDPRKRLWSDFISDYSLLQSVPAATYRTGSLLDLLMSNFGHYVELCTTRFCHFCPHKFVLARINVPRFA